jgi:hypothetical protein
LDIATLATFDRQERTADEFAARYEVVAMRLTRIIPTRSEL